MYLYRLTPHSEGQYNKYKWCASNVSCDIVTMAVWNVYSYERRIMLAQAMYFELSKNFCKFFKVELYFYKFFNCLIYLMRCYFLGYVNNKNSGLKTLNSIFLTWPRLLLQNLSSTPYFETLRRVSVWNNSTKLVYNICIKEYCSWQTSKSSLNFKTGS